MERNGAGDYSHSTERNQQNSLLREPKVYGHRTLYQLPAIANDVSSDTTDKEELLQMIRNGIVGRDLVFASPFGSRRVVYCDYTASGKSLSFIEDYIRDVVLPHYANTHTTTTVTSLQTTLFRDEARGVIRNSVNANEHDAVLFAGSGSTGAVHKLIRALDLREPPVVFVGPYEHHSVLLPWRELRSEMVTVPEDSLGLVDIAVLELELRKRFEADSTRRMIGCFSAASNVTGILTDTVSITTLLHRYNALSFWDYSACAPYTNIDMNPLIPGDSDRFAHKDAIFFSVHKFIGGVSTPGILVAKKRLFTNPIPEQHGGGTVFFVNSKEHRYLKEIENREEGGTSAIVEAIRAGIVFRLKDAVTSEIITRRDDEIVARVKRELIGIPNLHLLGSLNVARLPVFSFVIRHRETNLMLHHNFICALLNDLFGIQSRAGCACAGPYAQHLLGIDFKLAEEIETVLMEDSRLEMHKWTVEFSQREVLRPGFVRINFPYFFTDDEVSFVCQSIRMVVEFGWRLLPLYQLNPETGEWRHKENTVFADRKWLSSIRFRNGGLEYPTDLPAKTAPCPANFSEVLKIAQEIFLGAAKPVYRTHLTDQEYSFDERAAKLRWFLLPSEARKILLNIHPLPEHVNQLFEPRKYVPSPIMVSHPKCENGGNSCYLNGDTERKHVSGQKNLSTVDSSKLRLGRVSAWHSPPKEIWKLMLTAIREFKMLKDGDRVLVCLSGGKDSLSLLHAMRQYQFYAKSAEVKINFDLGAVTVDPGASSYDPSPLIPYLETLGIPYFYEKQGIMNLATSLKDGVTSICSFCSRMKRGRLYSCARREGYNVLAFGQHLDDLTESFLMSIFHNGRLRTMKAAYTVVEGDLRMIRPLVYVRERDTRRFAETRRLPVVAENCPACFEAPKERFRVKQLLAAQELLFPGLYDSLKVSMKPLMAIRTAGAENFIEQLPDVLDKLFIANLKNGVNIDDAAALQSQNDDD